jgi:hypothetical protein
MNAIPPDIRASDEWTMNSELSLGLGARALDR